MAGRDNIETLPDHINPYRRNNLTSVLAKYNFTCSTPVYLDILKDLCSDGVDNDSKLNLLLLLEEHASALLSTPESIEQVVGSLQSLNKQLNEIKNFFISRQVLITSTVVLLTSSNTDTDPLLCDLLYKHVDYLLQIVTSAPSKNSPLLKLAACQCLQEIEAAFPAISFSASCLESLWLSCSHETTVAFQAYASLLALILRNTSNVKNEALQTEGKLLPHSPGCEESVDRIPIAMFLVDLLPLLSSATLHSVLSCLMSGPEGKHEAFARNLQIWIPSLFQSSYLPLNHLALCACKAGYSDDEEGLKSLLETANHPFTPVSHRLIILDWIDTALKTNLWKMNVELRKGLCWTPNAFDGADSQGKKLKLLGHVYPKEILQQVLLQFLGSLQDAGGRSTVVLYRALLYFYLKLRNIELENHICRVVVELLRMSFGTVKHLLNFTETLQKSIQNSHLAEMILDRSVNWMTEVSKTEAVHHLDSYLYGLQKLGQATESAPARIKCLLQYLHDLIAFSNAHKDWLQGHKILESITALLHRNDIMLLYSDLGELLYLLQKSGTSDVDVRSRATICYAALTSVTSQNLCRLLPSDTSKDSLSIPHFLSDHNTSSFPCAYPLQLLPANVVSLSRCSTASSEQQVLNFENGFDMNLYYEGLPSVSVVLQYELRLCPEREDLFKVVFGLQLKIHQSGLTSTTESILIPALTEDHEDKGYSFSFKTKPLEARPLSLKFTLELTTVDYQSFRGDLGEHHIPVGEILQPLPVPAELKPQVFEELWKQTGHAQLGRESACSLKMSTKHLQALWKNYLISTEKMDQKAAMFLVPSTHILVHIVSAEEAHLQIIFKTDNWNVIPWFINYLNNIGM